MRFSGLLIGMLTVVAVFTAGSAKAQSVADFPTGW